MNSLLTCYQASYKEQANMFMISTYHKSWVLVHQLVIKNLPRDQLNGSSSSTEIASSQMSHIHNEDLAIMSSLFGILNILQAFLLVKNILLS